MTQALDILTHPNLTTRHAFFTRKGGVSGGIYASLQTGPGAKGDTPENVAENRRRAAQLLSVEPSHLVSAYQIHSARAVVVEAPFENAPEADGLVTATKGLALGILTADCAPILFHDAQAEVIGACHAGWKGALSGVIEATLAEMQRLGAQPQRIAAVIGPTIGPDWYEVGPEYQERFMADAPENTRFFRPSPHGGHALFDLPGYCQHRLRTAGIADPQWIGTCTYADETRFFSNRRALHRSEGDYGRLLSGIVV